MKTDKKIQYLRNELELLTNNLIINFLCQPHIRKYDSRCSQISYPHEGLDLVKLHLEHNICKLAHFL